MNGGAFLVGLGIGVALGRRREPQADDPFDVFDGLDDDEMVETYVKAKSTIPDALGSSLAHIYKLDDYHDSAFLQRWAGHLEKTIAERGGEVDPPNSMRGTLSWRCLECGRDLTVALHSPSCLTGYLLEAKP